MIILPCDQILQTMVQILLWKFNYSLIPGHVGVGKYLLVVNAELFLEKVES